MVFPHLCGTVHHESHVFSTGFSQHDLRELHAFFEVEKTCAARLRKEMHGVVWRMEMVAVSENVHFRRSKFVGIVME